MVNLKKILIRKELTIGSWISIDNPITCEIMSKSGFDWLVIDLEHTSISEEGMFRLIQLIDLTDTTPLVRVGENNPLLIKKALDAGAHGIIVPMVNSVEDARKAVNSIYYPTKGNRGVGLYRAHEYGMEFNAYKDKLDEQLILVVQIEHYLGVKNLHDILSVDGVDGYIIGPYDLSGSVGYPGEFDHPVVTEQLNLIKEALAKENKPGGFHIVHSDHNELIKRINEGYKFIAYGDDMVFFAEKVKNELEFVKGKYGGSTD